MPAPFRFSTARTLIFRIATECLLRPYSRPSHSPSSLWFSLHDGFAPALTHMLGTFWFCLTRSLFSPPRVDIRVVASFALAGNRRCHLAPPSSVLVWFPTADRLVPVRALRVVWCAGWSAVVLCRSLTRDCEPLFCLGLVPLLLVALALGAPLRRSGSLAPLGSAPHVTLPRFAPCLRLGVCTDC